MSFSYKILLMRVYINRFFLLKFYIKVYIIPILNITFTLIHEDLEHPLRYIFDTTPGGELINDLLLGNIFR